MEETQLTIPAGEDYHNHLRQGDLMHMVVPNVSKGGVCRTLVMPNLQPPITTVARALEYRTELQAIDSSVEYLMTLYLSPDLTPAVIEEAAGAGITGVKSYPRGVTTNSESGIESYTAYYDVFRAMEKHGIILHLHGEVPSDHGRDVCVLNAEIHFLEHLEQLHRDFPNLRIILEHATTRQAVEMVKRLGPSVAATITAHHLELVLDNWAGQPHNFCKPVAKYPADREALREVVRQGHPKFFLGSDSAPHPRRNKENACCSAGVFTTPLLMPYVVTTLARIGCDREAIVKFTSENGRAFYRLPDPQQTVTLVRQPTRVPLAYPYGADGDEVVPFLAGQDLDWSIKA